ncbi:MAG: 3-phosphoshikimate 1-carboxyvinyltransferase [Lachnospiraceae bacterium]|nr:3-phosphoshikimate 1-carboxyvinyltransferase [Lachnospiraceae bacterium]
MADTGNEKAEFYEIKRPTKPIHWEVEVPGSKSITNRALLLSALADGPVEMEGVLFSDDSRAFLDALRALGFSVEMSEQDCRVRVQGLGGRIPRSEAEINVGSAGTAARFLTALLGLSDGTYRIRASLQMEKRPMRSLFEALLSLGAQITWLGEEWHLPIEISGAAKQKDQMLSPAQVELDIGESTQFLSALLMAAPMLSGGLKIVITGGKKDGPYVRMTRRMMRDFGVEVRFEDSAYFVPAKAAYAGEKYHVEPDVSAACYFYGAAAVTGGYVRVNRIYGSSMQGDLKFLDVLERMGCVIWEEADGIAVSGPAAGSLKGIPVDMRDFSDQALTLAAIAPYANASVRISNIAHVRQQESDRIHSIVTNLRRAGISCEEFPDGVSIEPGMPKPCRIETFDDHRVAMAFAVMGLGADGIVIDNPGCCSKTFENYFELLDSLTRGSD